MALELSPGWDLVYCKINLMSTAEDCEVSYTCGYTNTQSMRTTMQQTKASETEQNWRVKVSQRNHAGMPGLYGVQAGVEYQQGGHTMNRTEDRQTQECYKGLQCFETKHEKEKFIIPPKTACYFFQAVLTIQTLVNFDSHTLPKMQVNWSWSAASVWWLRCAQHTSG